MEQSKLVCGERHFTAMVVLKDGKYSSSPWLLNVLHQILSEVLNQFPGKRDCQSKICPEGNIFSSNTFHAHEREKCTTACVRCCHLEAHALTFLQALIYRLANKCVG